MRKTRVSKASKIKTTGYTDETIIKAIKGSGGIITSIANKLGCAWDTANKYVNKNEATRTAYKNEKEQILDLSENVVYESIKAGNTQRALAALKVEVDLAGNAMQNAANKALNKANAMDQDASSTRNGWYL